MLWFNNHTYEQERFYNKAHQMMREQRNASMSDGEKAKEILCYIVFIPVFIWVLSSSHDIALALGAGFLTVFALMLLCVIFPVLVKHTANKSDEKYTDKPITRSYLSSHMKVIGPRKEKKEEYYDDTL